MIRDKLKLLIAILAFVPACLSAFVPSSSGEPMPGELSDSGVNRDVSELMARYFTDVSARLQKIVMNPPGTTQSSREFRQAFAAQRVEQIDRILLDLKGKASGWVGANMPDAYRAGLLLGTKQAQEAGVQPAGALASGSFSLIDVRTVQQFALDTVTDLHKAADSMGAQAKGVLRTIAAEGITKSQLNTILAGGVIEGKPAQAIRELREQLKKVHGDTVEINGRNYPTGYYAEMVVRTQTRQATVQARHGRLEDLGLDLVAIVGRVSQSFCTAFLGQVFSLSGKSSKYPAYSSLPGGGPPFHPNCSKSTRPFVEELASDQQLEAAGGVDGAEKLLGKNQNEAQRSFKDLQLHAAVKESYATTEKKLFG